MITAFQMKQQEKSQDVTETSQLKTQSEVLSSDTNASTKLFHDLKDNLSGICSGVEVLKNGRQKLMDRLQKVKTEEISVALKDELLKVLESQQESIDSIESSANHQKSLSENIIQLSKLKAGKESLTLTEMNPKTVITDAMKMLKSRLDEKAIEMYYDFTADDFVVSADSYRITRILSNLVSNAIKFTPQQGRIKIGLAKPEVNSDNTILKFYVKDNGIGMTEAEKERIFSDFTQANAQTQIQYGGYGLGLSICKHLVELMGGSIQVESSKGKGTKFTFTIKCAPILVKSPKPPSPIILSVPKLVPIKDKHVLIVEDQSCNQKMLQRALEYQGYTCTVASNGKEAVEAVQQDTQQKIDTIIMDTNMPVMSGIEAIKLIRENERKIGKKQPVFIISLSGTKADKNEEDTLRSAGANECMTKPFEVKAICQKIESSSRIIPLVLDTPTKVSAVNK